MHVRKLKAKMVELGVNVGFLAETLGVDRATLYRKLQNGGENITIKEAKSMGVALQLSPEEVNAIFFDSDVA